MKDEQQTGSGDTDPRSRDGWAGGQPYLEISHEEAAELGLIEDSGVELDDVLRAWEEPDGDEPDRG